MRRRRQRGQAVVETAILLPLLTVLFVGVYAAATALQDVNSATAASRAGARIAAALGQGQYPGTGSPSAETDRVDTQIASAVGQALGTNLKGVDTSTVRVVIYQPELSQAAADWSPSTQRWEQYVYDPGSGTWVVDTSAASSAGPFTVDRRSEVPGNDVHIGVKVFFGYAAPAPFGRVFPVELSQYTVMNIAPRFS